MYMAIKLKENENKLPVKSKSIITDEQTHKFIKRLCKNWNIKIGEFPKVVTAYFRKTAIDPLNTVDINDQERNKRIEQYLKELNAKVDHVNNEKLSYIVDQGNALYQKVNDVQIELQKEIKINSTKIELEELMKKLNIGFNNVTKYSELNYKNNLNQFLQNLNDMRNNISVLHDRINKIIIEQEKTTVIISDKLSRKLF